MNDHDADLIDVADNRLSAERALGRQVERSILKSSFDMQTSRLIRGIEVQRVLSIRSEAPQKEPPLFRNRLSRNLRR